MACCIARRTRTSDSLAVCFGLSSTHYHISGERVFEQMLYGDDYIPPAVDPALANPFLLKRTGNPQASGLVLIATLWLAMTISPMSGLGIDDPSVWWLMPR